MDELFNVAVPDEELEAPAFEIIPTGAYRSTLQAGTQVAEKNGWTRFQLPFRGFQADGRSFEGRVLTARFPIGAPASPGNDKAVSIGRRNVIGAAAALGLTEPIEKDGKVSQKLVASSNDELAQQFNAMAGTDVEVYVKARARERAGQPVLKADGTPVMDNEIVNVRAARAGR
jgi:hypothetical protein